MTKELGLYPATIFHRPNGRQTEIEIRKIYKDDASWLKSKNIALSLEDTGAFFVLYFDYGKKDEDGEPIEFIEKVGENKSCEDAIASAVVKLKEIVT